MDSRVVSLGMPGVLVIGPGAADGIGDQVARLRASRPLVVTDKGVARAGILDRVASAVSRTGAAVPTYDAVEPDPSFECVQKCADALRQGGHDLVIGLGGGSAMDTAKAAAIVAVHRGAPGEYVGVDVVPGPGLPVVAVPTTSGTGSEASPVAVLSDVAESLKKAIVSPHLYAAAAIVDPTLTLSLPRDLTAATGMDALTHAVEGVLSAGATPFTDAIALESVRLIGANLRQAAAHGDDLDARYAMSRAATFAGMLLGSAKMHLIHAISHTIGGIYHTPHGVANALVLPYVMEYLAERAPERLVPVAAALGEDTAGMGALDAARSAAAAVRCLSQDLGVPQRLSELGVPQDGIQALATGACRVRRLLDNAPVPMRRSQVAEICRNAY